MTSSQTMNQKDRVGTLSSYLRAGLIEIGVSAPQATELRSAESTVNHGAEWRRGQASFECGRSEDTHGGRNTACPSETWISFDFSTVGL